MTARAVWLGSAALLALPAHAATGQALAPLPFKSGAIAFGVHVHMAPGFTGHVAVDSASFTGTTLADVRGYVVVRADSMRTGIGLRDHHMRNAMETAKYPEIRFELLRVRAAGTETAGPAGGAGEAGAAGADSGATVTGGGTVTILPPAAPGTAAARQASAQAAPDAPGAAAAESPGKTAHGDTTAVTYIGRLTLHGVTRDDTIPGTIVRGRGTLDATARFPLDMREYGIKPPTRLLVITVQPVVDITVRLHFEAAPAAGAKTAAGP